jgi:hypothetical protein
MSFDSFDDTQIKKKVDKETADLQRKNCWVNTTISNLRDENIRLGHTELDTRNASWSSGSLFDCKSHDLKSFQKTYKKQRRYRSAILEDNSHFIGF